MRQTPDAVDASVLVPVLDEGEGIRATVAAMQAQNYAGTIEFLFADGRSSDDTRAQLEALARTDPRIRVLDNPRRGTASGLNVCLREARGTYVARMDAHTTYTPDYVRLGVERLERGGVDWVSGAAVPEGRGAVSRTVAAALLSWLGRGGSRKWAAAEGGDDELELDTGVFGGVWRRADVLARGGWDEGWPRNQDSEMAARFLRSGARIVMLTGMGARYQARDSFGGLFRQYRGYGMYRARTACRHETSLRRSAMLPPLVVTTAAAAVVSPRSLRGVARVGLGLYGVVLAGAALPVLRRGDVVEGALMPAVLATMHVGHGIGFFEGSRRWGPPWAALARVAGVRSGPVEPYAGPVESPSLTEA